MNMTFLQEMFNNITQRDALLRRRHVQHQSRPRRPGGRLSCPAGKRWRGSSIALASRALAMYERLDGSERRRFFARLAEEFAADPTRIDQAYAAYRESRDNATLNDLFEACEPRRQELFRRLNLARDGTYQLVRMREDLLALRREHPELAASMPTSPTSSPPGSIAAS